MISAFDVYLVMQLDAVGTASVIVSILAIGATGLRALWAADMEESFGFAGYALAALALASISVATFLPSTKTAAAMIVLPALTSDEVVQPAKKEAAELYDLAKQALRQAVEDKPKKADQ